MSPFLSVCFSHLHTHRQQCRRHATWHRAGLSLFELPIVLVQRQRTVQPSNWAQSGELCDARERVALRHLTRGLFIFFLARRVSRSA